MLIILKININLSYLINENTLLIQTCSFNRFEQIDDDEFLNYSHSSPQQGFLIVRQYDINALLSRPPVARNYFHPVLLSQCASRWLIHRILMHYYSIRYARVYYVENLNIIVYTHAWRLKLLNIRTALFVLQFRDIDIRISSFPLND